MIQRRFSFHLLLFALILSACAPSPGAVPATPTDISTAATPAPEADHNAMSVPDSAEDAPAAVQSTPGDETMSAADAAAGSADEGAMVPAWQTIALTNAVTGAPFTVADFAGKTVFIEPFATWCSNCRRQLGTVDSLRAQSGDDVVFLALSVEANVGNEALADYAAQTGYGLIFAAMPPEMLRLLVEAYGQSITNPPATPHFVVGPDGTSSDLFTGFQSGADIQAVFASVGG